MNLKACYRIIGSYLFIFAGFAMVGLGVSLYFQFFRASTTNLPSHVTSSFLTTVVLSLICGAIFRFFSRKSEALLPLKEIIFSLLSIWILTIFFAALPFSLSGVLSEPMDAIFEAVSGLTTTGSTIMYPKEYNSAGQEIPIHRMFFGFQKIEYTFYGTIKPLIFYGTIKPVIDPVTHAVLLKGIEAVPEALLFWRSFISWIGGAAIIFLFVAILPTLGVRGKSLFRYESTGPVFHQLFPQVRKSAIVLFAIYLGLTILCICALLWTNPKLPVFEAINIAFVTVSTCGFSTKNASIAAYNCFSTEVVVMIFMIFGAINFTFYYDLLRGRFYRLFEPEFLVFLGLLLAFCLLASSQLVGTEKIALTGAESVTYTVFDSIRYGFFQIISSMTNTGLATINYDQWPFFSQNIMLVVMYLGGMAGSTASGLKIIRVCILWQCARYAIKSLFQPSAVQVLRVGTREINQETATGVLTFFLVMVASSLVGISLLIFSGVDLETSLSLNGCMINNCGISFRMAGPTEACAFLSPFGKSICIAWMLLGRLEYYAWFALLLPSFWKSK